MIPAPILDSVQFLSERIPTVPGASTTADNFTLLVRSVAGSIIERIRDEKGQATRADVAEVLRDAFAPYGLAEYLGETEAAGLVNPDVSGAMAYGIFAVLHATMIYDENHFQHRAQIVGDEIRQKLERTTGSSTASELVNLILESSDEELIAFVSDTPAGAVLGSCTVTETEAILAVLRALAERTER